MGAADGLFDSHTGTLIHPMPSAHPAVGRGPVRSGRYRPLAGCPTAPGVAYPCVYALTSTGARHVATVRDLDLRPVTERRSVHLKEIRGTPEASGSSPPRPTIHF
jgi:hypothetical protein